MGAHKTGFELAGHEARMPYPAAGSAIVAREYDQFFPLDIEAGETETGTIAAPAKAGQRIHIVAVAVGGGGSRALTAPAHLNVATNTIITFDAVGERVCLESYPVAGGTAAWKIAQNDGATLS